jgi:hypothetical protein
VDPSTDSNPPTILAQSRSDGQSVLFLRTHEKAKKKAHEGKKKKKEEKSVYCLCSGVSGRAIFLRFPRDWIG